MICTERMKVPAIACSERMHRYNARIRMAFLDLCSVFDFICLNTKALGGGSIEYGSAGSGFDVVTCTTVF